MENDVGVSHNMRWDGKYFARRVFLGCDAVWWCRMPRFHRNMLFPSSPFLDLWNIVILPRHYTSWQSIRTLL